MSSSLFAVATALVVASAQNGDVDGEVQPYLPVDLDVPEAPALSAAEELDTFRIAKGFSIELVAEEPLVRDPVAAVFDLEGDLWVCEMSGYMPDAEGRGEDAETGAIVRLVDADGDGRMDERHVFMDGLVLPRALLPFEDGWLVLAPPRLIHARDTDGDGRADTIDEIARGFGGIASPEHAANTPLWGLDNWLELCNHSSRYRRVNGAWTAERTGGGGQWGMSRDEAGRIYFNTNSDPLRMDLFSSHYAVRNPNLGRAPGINVRVAKERAVWPGRITPGVNRGYQAATLRDDFTLASFTSACAPHVFRGDGLGAECVGNAFVAEPAGNLVQRLVIRDADGAASTGVNPHPGREFLTSTDERFRPVNFAEGPDGALYVVDMYRGVIQHRIFMTSFLRRQVDERGLAAPLHLGRIWRVVAEGVETTPGPALEEASWTEIVACLDHPSGWWRDTAQRILVEEGGRSEDARELCAVHVTEGATALGRLHALWSLEGLGSLDAGLVREALGDGDERVRLAAVRCSERFLAADAALVARLAEVARTGSADIRRQVVLSLGEAGTERAEQALFGLVFAHAEEAELLTLALSGVGGRELEVLRQLVEGGDEVHGAAVEALAKCVVRSRRSDRIDSLLNEAATAAGRMRAAIVAGILAGRPPAGDGSPAPIPVATRPDVLDLLDQTGLEDAFVWPGKPGAAKFEVRPMNGPELARFEQGRRLFVDHCAVCHQQSGLGEPGKAPPLRHSPFVLGEERRLVRIVAQGLTGPVRVGGETWDMDMPAWNQSDAEIAAVLTYLRREWGHGADPVTAERVGELRGNDRGRAGAWTIEELERE